MCAALVVFLGSRSRSTYDNIVDGLQKEGRRRLLLENTHGTEGHLPNTEYRIYGRGGGEARKTKLTMKMSFTKKPMNPMIENPTIIWKQSLLYSAEQRS